MKETRIGQLLVYMFSLMVKCLKAGGKFGQPMLGLFMEGSKVHVWFSFPVSVYYLLYTHACTHTHTHLHTCVHTHVRTCTHLPPKTVLVRGLCDNVAPARYKLRLQLTAVGKKNIDLFSKRGSVAVLRALHFFMCRTPLLPGPPG